MSDLTNKVICAISFVITNDEWGRFADLPSLFKETDQLIVEKKKTMNKTKKN